VSGSTTGSVEKSGYVTQSGVGLGTGSLVTVSLARAGSWVPEDQGSDPEAGGGEEGGGFPGASWWEDLFRDMFIPSETTWAKWHSLIDDIKGWGPFGVVTAFMDALANPGIVAGPQDLIYDIGWEPFGAPGSGYVGAYLDLRPALGVEDAPYSVAPESRGSLAGSFLVNSRWLWSLILWVLFGLFVYKRVLPVLAW
jgi:hypothetical protein